MKSKDVYLVEATNGEPSGSVNISITHSLKDVSLYVCWFFSNGDPILWINKNAQKISLFVHF